MPRCEVSEKTLELNVSENIITILRRMGSQFSRAYLYGFTVHEESRTGLDISIKIVPFYNVNYSITGFQFKRPISLIARNKYKFLINVKSQHLKLFIHAIQIYINTQKYPQIYYALPCICQKNELNSIVPMFLTRTWFIHILDLIDAVDLQSHNIILDFSNGKYQVYSPPQETERQALSFEELVDKLRALRDRDKLPRLPEAFRQIELTIDDILNALLKLGFDEDEIARIQEVLATFFRILHERKTTTKFNGLLI